MRKLGFREVIMKTPIIDLYQANLCGNFDRLQEKYIPNAIFTYPPPLQAIPPRSIDCSQPLSAAQTQTQNALCPIEAAQIGSCKKETKKLSFFFVSSRHCVGKLSKVSRRPLTQRI